MILLKFTNFYVYNNYCQYIARKVVSKLSNDVINFTILSPSWLVFLIEEYYYMEKNSQKNKSYKKKR